MAIRLFCGFILLLLLSLIIVVVLSLISLYLPNRSVVPTTKTLRIAIIGAGISGLNAGLALLDSNLFTPKNIIIYDANTDIGGRIHSRSWSVDNQTSEWCGEFLDGNNDVMLKLTRRFEINLIDTIAASSESRTGTFYYLGTTYDETAIANEYVSISSIVTQQVQQIGEINYSQSNDVGRFFDNLSLYDWIEQYVPNGHRSLLGRYIDSEFRYQYGLDTQELNSILFLKTIADDQSTEETSNSRYRMMGGNDQLPKKIAQYLTNNGIQIQLNYSLTKIAKVDKKKYRLFFSNGDRETFDHVILALPLTTLRYVDYTRANFDTLKRRVISDMKYGTNTKLNLQFSRRFWYDLSSDGTISTDLSFLTSWETSLGQSGTRGILALLPGGTEGTSFTPRTAFDVISSSAGNISTTIYIQKFLSNLNQIWPGASSFYTGEATVSAPWFSPYFLGSYPAYTIGQYSTIHGYESARQGNVHFTGDYTSIDYFGLMEGAASEGERAAKEIIREYS